jgi:hypothetical protein
MAMTLGLFGRGDVTSGRRATVTGRLGAALERRLADLPFVQHQLDRLDALFDRA